MNFDILLVEADGGGRLVAHRADCAVVQRHRAEERPIFIMLGIEQPLPLYLGRHECLLSEEGKTKPKAKLKTEKETGDENQSDQKRT